MKIYWTFLKRIDRIFPNHYWMNSWEHSTFSITITMIFYSNFSIYPPRYMFVSELFCCLLFFLWIKCTIIVTYHVNHRPITFNLNFSSSPSRAELTTWNEKRSGKAARILSFISVLFFIIIQCEGIEVWLELAVDLPCLSPTLSRWGELVYPLMPRNQQKSTLWLPCQSVSIAKNVPTSCELHSFPIT